MSDYQKIFQEVATGRVFEQLTGPQGVSYLESQGVIHPAAFRIARANEKQVRALVQAFVSKDEDALHKARSDLEDSLTTNSVKTITEAQAQQGIRAFEARMAEIISTPEA